MSKFLTNIFSKISKEEIIKNGLDSKIPQEKIDKISFDIAELFISALMRNNRDEKNGEIFFNNILEERNTRIFSIKDLKKITKFLSKKNNIEKGGVENFIGRLSVLVCDSLRCIFEETKINYEIFYQVVEMAEKKQKEESISKKGILLHLDLNRGNFLEKIICFFKKR